MTPSTAYSRDLGDELRRLRETCTGLKGHELAKKLGWDPSKVSTVEHGKARASEVDLIQYLSMCGKDIDFLNDFKQRYQTAFDEYILQLKGNLRTVAMAESTADSIVSYDTLLVPGLRPGGADPGTRAGPDGTPGNPEPTRSGGLRVLSP